MTSVGFSKRSSDYAIFKCEEKATSFILFKIVRFNIFKLICNIYIEIVQYEIFYNRTGEERSKLVF